MADKTLPPHIERAVEAWKRVGSYPKMVENGWNYNTARARLSEARHMLGELPLVFDGKIAAAASIEMPLYTGWGEVKSDRAIILGDVHVPYTDWDLANKVHLVAQRFGVKDLFIIGDLLNFGKLGIYPATVPDVDLRLEYRAARLLMESWLDTFDRIFYRMGNHEHRLWKMLSGDQSIEDFQRVIGAFEERVDASAYTQVVIHSGGQVWRATHQRNYSRIKGRVANVLAQKYQCNVILHHQHHASKMFDDWNRYVCIDNGGLFDPDKMAYVRMVDNTSPEMSPGFTLLIDGTAELLTPHPAFTKWENWI